MPNRLMLDRRTLAQLLQNNSQAISAFEQVLGDVGETLPSTVEEANALAGQALAVAQSALASLAALADALAQVQGTPAPLPQIDQDNFTPASAIGSLGEQNADAVTVTGGAIDNTPIGGSTPAAGAFTIVSGTANYANPSDLQLVAAGNIAGSNLRSTGGGRLSFVTGYIGANVSSILMGVGTANPTTEAMRFNHSTGGVQIISAFGCNGKGPQASATLGNSATDLASVLTLANNMRAALIANGIGQ